MSKKKPVSNVPQPQPAKVQAAAPEVVSKVKENEPFTLFSFKGQALILALIGLIFYANTFSSSWAYDDLLVIKQNEYVMQGMSGIPKLLATDAFESYTRKQNEKANQLTGGRYRPLSMVTFAIEQTFFGSKDVAITDTSAVARKLVETANKKAEERIMHIRHVVNVLLYIFSAIVLLRFLRGTVFKKLPLAAFLTALIFVIHPIHTEVVANIKSRDEIMSLLFITLTLLSALDYFDTKNKKYLFYSCLYTLLALLSKEYGIVLVFLIPLTLYMFRDAKPKEAFGAVYIYFAPIALYGIMRMSSVVTGGEPNTDVMNNPYILASVPQKIATIVTVLLLYVKLLFFPHPLTSDYTFNQVPYVDFSSPLFWASLALHAGLVFMMIKWLKERHVLGYALATYFLYLGLVSNIVVNIGSPMGERLVYHSSLGFAMILGWALAQLYQKMSSEIAGKAVVGGLMLVLVGASGFKTITRNHDWSANKILFLKDAQTATNSVIANTNAGMACIEWADGETTDSAQKNWYRKAVKYLDKAISINNEYVVAHLNRGVCYVKLGDMEAAAADCDSVQKMFPDHPNGVFLAYLVSDYYNRLGLAAANQNNQPEAIKYYIKASYAWPSNADIMYNLAYAYCKTGEFQSAYATLQRALANKPDHAKCKELMNIVKAGLDQKHP